MVVKEHRLILQIISTTGIEFILLKMARKLHGIRLSLETDDEVEGSMPSSPNKRH